MVLAGIYPSFFLLPAHCRRRWRTKGNTTMNDITTGLDQADEETLTYSVSDEAIEAAASSGKEKAANFTLGACTALSVCPD
jgi:hypothetical protein